MLKSVPLAFASLAASLLTPIPAQAAGPQMTCTAPGGERLRTDGIVIVTTFKPSDRVVVITHLETTPTVDWKCMVSLPAGLLPPTTLSLRCTDDGAGRFECRD